MTDHQLEQIVRSARASAAGSHGVLSTGEGLAAALIRNRPDLLGSYTIVEALERIGEHWASLLPAAAHQFRNEQDHQRDQIEQADRAKNIDALEADAPAGDSTIDANARLVTYSTAPGYRTLSLVVDVQPLGASKSHRLGLHFTTGDSLQILDHLHEINRCAWTGRRGTPIDQRDGEQRPRWIGA